MSLCHERIENFVIPQNSHQGTVSDWAHEVLLPIGRLEQVDCLAVLQLCHHAQVGVFSVSGNALHRFCQEGNFQVVGPEYVPDDVLNLAFVVRRLQRVGVLPVDFQLLHDVVEVAAVAHLGTNAAHFFMTHFHFESVAVQNLQSLFHRRSNRSDGALPILLFQFLGGVQLVAVRPVVRCFYPEFQLGGTGEHHIFNIFRRIQASDVVRYVWIVLNQFH